MIIECQLPSNKNIDRQLTSTSNRSCWIKVINPLFKVLISTGFSFVSNHGWFFIKSPSLRGFHCYRSPRNDWEGSKFQLILHQRVPPVFVGDARATATDSRNRRYLKRYGKAHPTEVVWTAEMVYDCYQPQLHQWRRATRRNLQRDTPQQPWVKERYRKGKYSPSKLLTW